MIKSLTTTRWKIISIIIVYFPNSSRKSAAAFEVHLFTQNLTQFFPLYLVYCFSGKLYYYIQTDSMIITESTIIERPLRKITTFIKKNQI